MRITSNDRVPIQTVGYATAACGGETLPATTEMLSATAVSRWVPDDVRDDGLGPVGIIGSPRLPSTKARATAM